MEPKRKQILMRQKAYFEKELQDRLAYLSGKGLESRKAERDTVARKLQADVKAVNKRLQRIAEYEKRTEEMAKIKAERAAAPRKEEEGKAEKPKKAAEEGKGKKVKAEKKAAAPKAPEGGKGATKKAAEGSKE